MTHSIVPTPGDMIQIHLLVSYPAALLNRDDSGLAKRVPFGGSVRTRVSSQCLKKHWRESARLNEHGTLATRSTRIYEQLIGQYLIDGHHASLEEATAIAQFLLSNTIQGGRAKDKGDGVQARTSQLLVLTQAEIEWLQGRAVNILKAIKDGSVDLSKDKDPVKAIEKQKGLDKSDLATAAILASDIDTAMFGRMVTSEVFRKRIDAAVHVAHALTTHSENSEIDYFTAVDTLQHTEETGAGLIQDTELVSGVYYIYSVVDMNQLRENLGHRQEDAEVLVAEYIRTMCTVSPGAKKGSTAPYAYAEFVLVERDAVQPRTLANAFRASIEGKEIMPRSVAALIEYRERMGKMYGQLPERAAACSIHPVGSADLSVESIEEAIRKVM